MKKLLFVFVMLAGLELIAAAGILVSSGTYDDSSRPAVGSGRRYGEYQGTPQGEIYIYKDHDPRFHIITDPVLTDNPVAYSGGLVILERDGLYGYADFDGNPVTDIQYENAGQFRDGLADVRKDGKYGFIDTAGREIIPVIYDQVSPFEDGYAAVRLDGKRGVIDKSGGIAVPIEHMHLFTGNDGIALTGTNVRTGRGKGDYRTIYGFANYREGTQVPYQYQSISNLSEGYYSVSTGAGYALMDPLGREVTKPVYDWIGSISGRTAAACLDGRCGYIDLEGREIVPFSYDDAFLFCYGRGAVSKDGKWGYVDRNGREVIGLSYDFACNFLNGLAVVILDGRYGLIDTNGNVRIPIQYDWAGALGEDGTITVMKDGCFGFVDAKGNEIAPPIYDYAYDFNGGYAKVELGGKTGYMDQKGRLAVPAVYDDSDGDKDRRMSHFYLQRDIDGGMIEVPLLPDVNVHVKKADSSFTGWYEKGWQVMGFYGNDGRRLASPGDGYEVYILPARDISYTYTGCFGKPVVFCYKHEDGYGLFCVADEDGPG